ncbi:MAG: FHA domain-containing protein, partial [Acidobacteria bacterium]|nr:FHA domain-containing protein [Acidobacteriota bacterium]
PMPPQGPPPLMPPPGFGAPPHGAPLYPAPAPEPTGSAKVPLLVVVMPTGEHIEYPLAQLPVGIGKGAHNPVVINHPTVSTSHAEIRAVGDQFEIVDLGSKNGTFVNDQPVTDKACPLTHGFKIRFGQVVSTFRNPQEKREATVSVDLDQLMQMGVAPRPTPQPPVKPKEKLKDEDEEKKDKKKKKKKKESKMGATLVNALSRIVAPIIAMLVSIYFFLPRGGNTPAGGVTPPTTVTQQTIKAGSLNFTDISGATLVLNSKLVLFSDGKKPDTVFAFNIDNQMMDTNEVKAVKLGASVSNIQGISFDRSRQYLYVIGSLTSSTPAPTNALLRVRMDPASLQLLGPPEVIADFRGYLLSVLPDLQASAAQGTLAVEGLAWNAFNNQLLIAMQGAGESSQVVPVNLRDPMAPLTTTNMEVSGGKPLSLNLKGQGVLDIQCDEVDRTIVLLTVQKTPGKVTAYRWNGQPDGKPDAFELVLSQPIDAKGLLHADIDQKRFWFILAANGTYVGVPEVAPTAPAAAPAPAP